MKKKIVYKYDEESKILMGPMECQLSPLEKGVWIVPSHSTEIKPPAAKKNQTLVFAGDRWKKVDNYFGQTFWDKKTKEAFTITEIGVSPKKTWTDQEPGEDDAWDETSNSWLFSKDVYNANIDYKIKRLRMQLFSLKKDIKEAQEFEMKDVEDDLKAQVDSLDKEIRALANQKK